MFIFNYDFYKKISLYALYRIKVISYFLKVIKLYIYFFKSYFPNLDVIITVLKNCDIITKLLLQKSPYAKYIRILLMTVHYLSTIERFFIKSQNYKCACLTLFIDSTYPDILHCFNFFII